MDKEFENWRLNFSKQFMWEEFQKQPDIMDEEMAIALARAVVTDLEMMSQDMLEHEVATSGNQEAKSMLAAIGIQCND